LIHMWSMCACLLAGWLNHHILKGHYFLLFVHSSSPLPVQCKVLCRLVDPSWWHDGWTTTCNWDIKYWPFVWGLSCQIVRWVSTWR
jgi:hypothetical protein